MTEVPHVVEEYYKYRELHDKSLDKLTKETDRIVKVIVKFFKTPDKKYWWAYKYYEDGDNDEPLPQMKLDKEWFQCYINHDGYDDYYDYDSQFPMKFFDMSDEQIFDYLSEEKSKIEDEEKKKIAKQRANKKDNDNKRKEVLKKLTIEERKLLGV